ncbi:MAG: GTP-binding protein [Oscillospiraceae bacterium]|nr:GTP-binding protein [Oscillospiraceae bacterium]
MIKVDLITGFLGAGKTTFLLRYARHLIEQKIKIGILVYDHGAVNVDFPLLNELRGEYCELEMLAGSCDPDCHRRRFRTKLISMAMSGYDRVLIEPSGVFDMDEFYDTLQEAPLDRWYEIGSVVTIVDAKLEEKLTEEEDFFLATQAASAGCVVLSRVQLAEEEDIERTLAHLRRAEERVGCPPTGAKSILVKPWDELTEEDYARLTACGYQLPEYVKTIAGQHADFQSLSFLDLPLTQEALREKTERLFHDSRYGRVLRVKGLFQEEGVWYQLNATAQETHVEPVPDTRAAIVVIGLSLNEAEINLLLTGKIPELHIL